MGDSLPPNVAFDLINSHARLRDLTVEIVLCAPTLAASKGVLVLSKGEKVVQGRVRLISDEAGGRLVAHVPRRRLGNGIWSLTMRSRAGDELLQARLLVQSERPLVLLWGAETHKSSVPIRRLNTPKRRAVRTANRALDEVLALLPPDRAGQVRAQALGAARRLLR